MIVLLNIDLDSTTSHPDCPGNPDELTSSHAALSAVLKIIYSQRLEVADWKV